MRSLLFTWSSGGRWLGSLCLLGLLLGGRPATAREPRAETAGRGERLHFGKQRVRWLRLGGQRHVYHRVNQQIERLTSINLPNSVAKQVADAVDRAVDLGSGVFGPKLWIREGLDKSSGPLLEIEAVGRRGTGFSPQKEITITFKKNIVTIGEHGSGADFQAWGLNGDGHWYELTGTMLAAPFGPPVVRPPKLRRVDE